MATITIPVKFDSDEGFTRPNIVTAKLGDTIKWQLRDEKVNRSSRRFERGLGFQIYFENGHTPFHWSQNSTIMTYPKSKKTYGGMELQMKPQEQTLAEAIAMEKGDYKYGLRVIDLSNERELFDDDPILRIV